MNVSTTEMWEDSANDYSYYVNQKIAYQTITKILPTILIVDICYINVYGNAIKVIKSGKYFSYVIGRYESFNATIVFVMVTIYHRQSISTLFLSTF